MKYFIQTDGNDNIIKYIATNKLLSNTYEEITKKIFEKIKLPSKVLRDTDGKIKSVKNIIVEKPDITKQIKILSLNDEIKQSDGKIYECFEHFMNKMMNCKTVTDLLKIFDYNDFPHDLKNLLQERAEVRKRIKEIESEEQENE